MDTVITRFAPSPTGFLHVGGARTALFNWLYSRHNSGKFVLRIEDTDLNRSTKDSVATIFDSLDWLGINWDDGPYFQSERFDIYSKYLEKLLQSGQAYYCNCSRDDVERMRKKALLRGVKPKYDGRCRNKELGKTANTVVRFKSQIDGITVIDDVVKGKITFQNSEQDDFIIYRSDRTPTYNFVVVVDDITMGINTIIRGDDHVMNTPKQISLYSALKCPLPVFGHLPMVLGRDKTRLSKRHGAMSVTSYRDMGYLPDAFINYIARLGWSHGDDEFFTREDLIKKFTLKNVGKSASVFDFAKLLALNAEHIRVQPKIKLTQHLEPFMKEREYDITNTRYLNCVVGTLRNRSKTLVELANGAHFYYKKVLPPYNTVENIDKILNSRMTESLLLLVLEIQMSETFDQKSQESAFKYVMSKTGLSFGKIAQSVRVALTGTTVSPGIFEMMEVLGKDIVIKRIKLAIDFISN